MTNENVPQTIHGDRRRWHRIKLHVPVQVSAGTGFSGPAQAPFVAQSVDLCPGGCYLLTSERRRFAPDELLAVSLVIPLEARQAFPFSRIAGLCRVLRADEKWVADTKRQGLALAFCEPHTLMLGAAVSTPPQEMVPNG